MAIADLIPDQVQDATSQLAADNSVPRGLSNNNPGNIKVSNIQWAGQVPGNDPEFVTFDSPESGLRAMVRNLMAKQNLHGLNTIKDLIANPTWGWAPGNENNTNAYIRSVSDDTGIGPNQKINLNDPNTLSAIVPAMIKHENGVNPYTNDQVSSGINYALNGVTPAQARQQTSDPIMGQMQQALKQPAPQQSSGGIIPTAYADTMPHPQDDPVMADFQSVMGNAQQPKTSQNHGNASQGSDNSDQWDGKVTHDASGGLTINIETPKAQPDPVMQDIQAAMNGQKPPTQQQPSYLDSLKYGFASDEAKKNLHPAGGLLGGMLQGVGMVPDALGAMAGGVLGSALGPVGTVGGTALGGMAGHQVDNLIGQMFGVQSPMTPVQQATDFGSNAVDNVTGALAGPVIDRGLGAAWTAGKNAVSTVKNAVTGGDAAVKAGQILRNASTGGVDNALNAINGQQGTIVGHNPTLGQLTDDSGFKALERSVFSSGDARTQGQYADRLGANRQAVTDAINSVTPSTDANATRNFLQQQHTNTQDYFANQEAAQQSDLDQKLTNAKAGMDKTGASEAARAQIESNLEAARGQERDLWQKIDPTGNTTADMTAINQKAQDLLSSVKKATNPADVPQVIRDIAGTDGQPLFNGTEPLDELTALRSRIGQELRDEQAATSPNRNKIRMLTELNNTVTDTMNGVGNRLSDPAVAARWQEANQFSAQLNDAYTKGLTGKMVYGDRVPDSATLTRYLGAGNGSKENAQAFIKAMGGTGQAEPYARDYLIHDALDKNVNPDGTVNIKNLNQWLQNNKDVLDQFPNVRNELSDVLKASQTLKNTGELKARTLDDFQQSTAGLYLKNDPAHVITSILGKSGDPVTDAQQLINQVRMNRDATAGVQRAVFDHMMGKVQSNMTEDVGGKGFVDYLAKNDGALKTMLTPQQYDMLQKVGEAVKMNSRVSNFNPVAGSQTVSNASAIPSQQGFKGKVFGMLLDKIKGLGGAAGAMLGGPMGAVGGVAADSAVNAVRNMSNEKVMGLLRDAFMDPKLAAKLMQPINKVTAPSISQAIRPYVVQSVVQPTFQQSPPHKVWHNMWQPSPSYQ